MTTVRARGESSCCGRATGRPAKAAFAALAEHRREAMREDMIGVWEAHNRADDGTLVVDADYLEAVVRPL
ncbi:hypothetical protein ACIBHX_03020 [Nonomuraea sp. NPDC050536]|uniref:hypothetical protein n=1 Tax=Nonomuraea sp. NPDC050536 TaxID=3364366 RepID=UPI0037C5731E